MEKVEEYLLLSQLYLKNADEMIKKKEYSKAGEMLWGAIAAVLKAVGIMYGKPIRTHKELIQTAKYISLAKNDVALREAIVNYAQALHANYYEEFIDINEFPRYYAEIMGAYKKLFNVILEGGKNIEKQNMNGG